MAEEFRILADENVAKAVVGQLVKNGIIAERVQNVLPESTPDPDVLEYCYQHGYALVTHDERITGHIKIRQDAGQEYCGVFIAGDHLQGTKGIGRIVTYLTELQELIAGEAASLEDDVYNQTRWI